VPQAHTIWKSRYAVYVPLQQFRILYHTAAELLCLFEQHPIPRVDLTVLREAVGHRVAAAQRFERLNDLAPENWASYNIRREKKE